MPVTCAKCGKPSRRTILQEKDDPTQGELWCPTCHNARQYAGVNLDHTFFKRDEYPGGITLENYGATPVTFYTESERLAYLQKHDLEHKERWCPFPGTDRDPAGVQNPDGYVDDVTMRNRMALFLRAHNAGHATDDSEKAMGSTFSGDLTGRDAVAVATNTDVTRQSRVGRRLKKAGDDA